MEDNNPSGQSQESPASAASGQQETATAAAETSVDAVAAKWQQIHATSVAQVSSLRAAAVGQFQTLADHYMAGAEAIINSQSAELAFFRTLETHVRNETLTEEIGKDILDKLLNLRAELRKAAEASLEQQKQ